MFRSSITKGAYTAGKPLRAVGRHSRQGYFEVNHKLKAISHEPSLRVKAKSIDSQLVDAVIEQAILLGKLQGNSNQSERTLLSLFSKPNLVQLKAEQNITSFVQTLIEQRQAYKSVEKLLLHPQVGGQYGILDSFVDGLEGIPDELADKWAGYLGHIHSKNQIVHYASSLKRKTTDRELHEYLEQFQMKDIPDYGEPLRLLNMGGGKSPIVKGFQNEKTLFKDVVNVEPVFPEHNPECETDKIPYDAVDHRTLARLKQDRGRYHEVWSSWAMPGYALFKKDIKAFYESTLLALKENGVLRLFPCYLNDADDLRFLEGNDPIRALNRNSVHKATIRAIKQLKESGLFLVDQYQYS